jgi:hypothetical protein
MISRKIQTLGMAGWLAWMPAFGGSAGIFVPPAEGPVAFRRDGVPLNVDTMGRLSRHLVGLVDGLELATANQLRAAAQMLAVALVLDPANAAARQRIVDLQKAKPRTPADSQALQKSRLLIWQSIAWLETPEAGEQGHALANCLKDVMTVADPAHARAEAMRQEGERGAWAGWVPSLAAYELREKPVVIPEKKPVEPAQNIPQIARSHSQVDVPLWQEVPNATPATWVSRVLPLEMKAEILEKTELLANEPFQLTIGDSESLSMQRLTRPLKVLLQNHYGRLPANLHISIGGAALEASMQSHKRHSLSAAAAVLANSAFTGIETDGIILGVVDETGAYKASDQFWNQLQSLGKGNGTRLVVPAETMDTFLALLALERPEFFLEYEVMMASDFKQLVLLTEKPLREDFAKSSAGFQEVRQKATPPLIGAYLANSHVRRRLEELHQEAPHHLSAKMLAIQGAGQRPTTLQRRILILEIQRLLEPMLWLVKRDNVIFDESEIASIGTTYKTCRSEIDRLLRYTEKNELPLISQVQEMLVDLRALDRATRARGDNSASVAAAARSMKAAYKTLDAQFGEASERSEPEVAPR